MYTIFIRSFLSNALKLLFFINTLNCMHYFFVFRMWQFHGCFANVHCVCKCACRGIGTFLRAFLRVRTCVRQRRIVDQHTVWNKRLHLKRKTSGRMLTFQYNYIGDLDERNNTTSQSNFMMFRITDNGNTIQMGTFSFITSNSDVPNFYSQKKI